MEFSIRMLVVALLVVIVFVVALVLLTGWFGSGNDLINGLFEFFENILSGKTVPSNVVPNPG